MRTWWPLVPLMAAACTAQIGSSQGPAGTGVSAAGGGGAGTTGGAGGGAVGSGGNSTGTTGGGNGATGGGSATSGPQDPGRVTIRRLNRAEYDNTVRDLLGTAQTPGATTFPSDAPALGFDNNGDLQTLSPVQFTLYQQAAESLAAEVMTVGSKERAALITCDLTTGMTCAQTLIQNIGLRAFRRPLTATEVTNFTGLMTTAAGAGATTDEQFRTVLEAMLQSPNFLFRPEIDANVTSLTPHTLSPYETASRLSYMVYRSMPDTALFTAAANGQLAQPSDVQTQLTRMLAASNSVFGPTFSSMWLGTSAVSTQSFDATLFPEFNANLANSMSLEVNDFFNEFVTQNEPVSELLTANFSYIDANLASLYQIPVPAGTGLVRTTLNTPQRGGGLLTMSGVLSVTSYPARTSVVKRGAWVLSQLMCATVPSPPAGVLPIADSVTTGTQAQILAAHRTNPSCSVCHDSMDNIGLAMENYDAVGAWRTTENGIAIDAAGSFTGAITEPNLPAGQSGPSFTGAVGLAAAVAADPRFVSCVAQNALSYSIGRTLLPTDAPYLTQIATAPKTGSLGVRDVLMNVVASDTFRMRRGDP
jgi:uncharacterized protein DUF1592/uncharacterized protein DUF1588/uncharacterized protein DUF1587/uncharacterized protein DUF1595/uncharacterized protein DUF1585